MKQELTQEQKEKIVEELNQPEQQSAGEGNVQVHTAKELGIFEAASARGDIHGRIAHFTALNVTSRARIDKLFDYGKLSLRNVKKAILAACAIPDGDADIKFGGLPEAQEDARALLDLLQIAINTRSVAIEQSIKLKLQEKQQAAKEQEAAEQGDKHE